MDLTSKKNFLNAEIAKEKRREPLRINQYF